MSSDDFRTVCGVVIEQDGKYLLVQERQPKAFGLWNLPAGHVDQGESLEQAAIREAKEETGFDVALDGHILELRNDEHKRHLHAYKAHITGGVLAIPTDELLGAEWFSYDEIVALKDKLRNIEYVLGSIDKARLA